MQLLFQRRFQFFYLSIFFFACECPAFSQNNKQPLELNRAINLAINNYPSIKSRLEQVREANAFLEATHHDWLPSLNLLEQVAVGTDNSLTSSYFPMGIIPSSSGGRRPENNGSAALGNIAAVSGTWEVYNFGGYRARINESIAGLHVREADLEKEKLLVTTMVVQNYFELVKYASFRSIQLNNIERTQTIKNAIQAFVSSGLRAGVDSSIAAAELSKARLILIEISNSYELVRNQLSILTGLDSSMVIPDTSINNELLAELLNTRQSDSAIMKHPVLNYYRSIYDQNVAKENLIRKNNLPKFSFLAAAWMRGSSISPTDEYKALSTGFSYTRYNYLTGISISYNLFDIKRTQYQYNIQKFRSQASFQDYQEQKLLLGNIISQADINISTAIKRLEEIPIQVKAARDAYDQKLALYNSGLTDIVDLTNVLYILNRAEFDKASARDAAWKAIFQKAYSANQLDQFLSSLK